MAKIVQHRGPVLHLSPTQLGSIKSAIHVANLHVLGNKEEFEYPREGNEFSVMDILQLSAHLQSNISLLMRIVKTSPYNLASLAILPGLQQTQARIYEMMVSIFIDLNLSSQDKKKVRLQLSKRSRERLNEQIVDEIEQLIDAGSTREESFQELAKKSKESLGYPLSAKAIEGRYARSQKNIE